MDKDLLQTTIHQMDDKNLRDVYQFLVDHNFENTVGALTIEAEKKGFKSFQEDEKPNSEVYSNLHEQIMLSYKSADGKAFFKLWNLLISEDLKQTRAYKVLTLNLHIYFTMLPKHTLLLSQNKERDELQMDSLSSVNSLNLQDSENEENSVTEIEKNMNDSMIELRKFFNTVEKELKNDAELQPFFALPFIEDPYIEPCLSKIFEKSWADELTEKLHVFLNECKITNSNSIRNKNPDLNKVSSIHESVSEESRKDVTKKKFGNNNVPIVPNDRNIPLLLDDDDDDVEYSVYNDSLYSQRSKSVQTVSINCTNEVNSSHIAKNNKKLMQYTQELATTKSHLCSVHFNYEKLKVRFYKLHADYHKLMSIARILTSALENSARGQPINFQVMLESCIQIFPALFNQNVRDTSYSSSELQLDKSRSDMQMVEYSTLNATSVPPKLLDFIKIKLHLINGNIKTKLFLLQALRRKITCDQTGERDEAIHEYIRKDLLGLHGQIASYRGKSILPYLLSPEDVIMPHPLQQSTVRLLNTLASFRCGRDYLSFDSTVVDMVFKCLNSICNNDVDTLTYDMMIAMLQKLSVRRQQRIYMIENGLVEWLIYHLHDQCHMIDSYRLEYATSLLMNLSLHQIAQRRVSTMASLLVSTLITLLLMDHTSTTSYVYGTLGNFLTNHMINEEAKKMKLSSVIEQYGKNKTGKVRIHLDRILLIHKGKINVNTDSKEVFDNDNEEFDVLEHQIEENDPVKNNYGELCGESLLVSCYTISSNVSQEKQTIVHASTPKQSRANAKIMLATQDNEKEVKNSFHESISHGKNLLSTAMMKEETRNKSNTAIVRNSVKKIDSVTSVKFHKKHYKQTLPHAKLEFNTNVLRSKQTRDKKSEAHNKTAIYLYENHSSKNSSKTTISSSITLGLENDTESTVMEKLSSIASLNIDNNNKITNDILWSLETNVDREEAFLAKPKLPRTPP